MICLDQLILFTYLTLLHVTREIIGLPKGNIVTMFPRIHLVYDPGVDGGIGDHKTSNIRLVNPCASHAKIVFSDFVAGVLFPWVVPQTYNSSRGYSHRLGIKIDVALELFCKIKMWTP